MGNTEDKLEFLSTYWEKAKTISNEIVSDLPKISENKIPEKGKIFIVQFSELGHNWSARDHLKRLRGISTTLELIADKISYMVNKGDAINVKPHIEKVIKEGVWTNYGTTGRDRSNCKKHKLTEVEIKRLKEYFNL